MSKNIPSVPSLLTADSIVDVQKVEFVGVDRTRLAFFERELKDAHVITREGGATTLKTNEILVKSNLSSVDNLKLEEFLRKEKFIPTLRNVHGALNQFTAKLLNSDLFEFVDTNLQINDTTNERFPATVIITLKEKGVPFLRTQTYIKAGKESDSGVELVGALRNPTGNGETIKIGTVGKAAGGQEYLFNLTVPHIGDTSGPFLLTLKSSEENQNYYSSFKQHITSLTAEYTHDVQAKHHFTAEYSIRDEIPMLLTDDKVKAGLFETIGATEQSFQRQASAAILTSAMSSIKTSLKYVWNAIDTRNSQANPTTGEYLQTSLELALPPGTAQFVKTDITTQLHRQLGPNYLEQPGLTFSMVGSIGLLYPLSVLFPSFYYNQSNIRASTSPLTSFLSDRYHLGGPLSLRGFDTSGVGPKDKSLFSHIGQSNDSLGGDTKSTFLAFLSVPVPVPILANSSFRAFWYFNAGSLGNSNYWKVRVLERLNNGGISTSSNNNSNQYQASELKGKTSPLFGYMRASIGSGISMSFQNIVRLEATYSVPILLSSNDRLKDFQLGVGLSIN